MQSQNKISMCCIFTQAVLQFKSTSVLTTGKAWFQRNVNYDIRFENKDAFRDKQLRIYLQVLDILNTWDLTFSNHTLMLIK